MPKRGYKQTEEHKKRLKENNKGMLGHHHSEQTKIKIREAIKGIPLSYEHKKHLSESHKGKGIGFIGTWNKGRKLSKEHKIKISESNMGKIGYWKGKFLSKEIKLKKENTILKKQKIKCVFPHLNMLKRFVVLSVQE